MIPKILHFIWLGKHEPPTVKFTVDAFKKANPDFEINFIREEDPLHPKNDDVKEVLKLITSPTPNKYREWFKQTPNFINRNTKNITDSCIKLFFENSFYASFSDAIRFYLLDKYGGIYLDCDMFPVRPFDDELLNLDLFYLTLRWYSGGESCYPDAGFVGLNPESLKTFTIKEFRNYKQFVKKDKIQLVNNCPYIFHTKQYKDLLGKYQSLKLEYENDFYQNDDNNLYVNVFSASSKYYQSWQNTTKQYGNGKISIIDKKPIDTSKSVIFTCFLNQTNYGQRLQAYALEKTIRNFGKDCRTIRFIYDGRDFESFENKYMNVLDISNSLKPLYDFSPTTAIIGSDQILNVNWTDLSKLQDSLFSMPYIFTYASSDGGDALKSCKNRNKVNELFKNLQLCSSISVREKPTAEYLSSELKREIRHDIDPIFLLTKSEWESIMEKPKRIADSEVFDFSYIVDRRKNSVEIKDGLKHYIQFGNTWKQGDSFSPNEFLWMIKNCRNYYTNSFHGFMFSLILNRKCGLDTSKQSSRFLDSVLNIEKINDIDFENINNQIKYYRESALQYLKEKL